MKKSLKNVLKKDYVRLALIAYSFILVISLVVIQYAIFGSKRADATDILTSYGIWCRGSEVDTIPGYEDLEVGTCNVPTDEDDKLNFDQCQDGTSIGQITYCDGVYDEDGACNGAESVDNFNPAEHYNCLNLADQYGKSIKIAVNCSANDTGDLFTLSQIVCQNPEANASANAVGNLDTIEKELKGDEIKTEDIAVAGYVTNQNCSGNCESGSECNVLGNPGNGNMWSCYEQTLNQGDYKCVSEAIDTSNTCFLNCSPYQWEPCLCDVDYCVDECKKEHAGDPGTYDHYEECGAHISSTAGCRQNYGCKCTILDKPTDTPTNTPSPTVTNTPTATPVSGNIRCVEKMVYEDDSRNTPGVYHLDHQIVAGSTVSPGDQIVYYVSLENNSSGTVNSPYYLDTINPDLYQYIEVVDFGSGCQFDQNDIRCDVATSLQPGGRAGKAFRVIIKDTAPAGMFTNIAQVFGDGTYQDDCRVSLNIEVTTTPTDTPTLTPTPTPGGVLKEISGRVHCQDDGDPDYAISGARVLVREPDGAIIEVVTDENGNYSRLIGLDWLGGQSYFKEIGVSVDGFDPADDQVIDLTGQAYSDMTPPPMLGTFAEYCSDTSITQCVVSGGLPTCGVASFSRSSSYANCGVVGDRTYNNFDFRFRDCTPSGITVVPDPGIDVTKVVLYDDDSKYEVGETVTFGITITNTGDVDLDTVELRDEFNIDKLEFLNSIVNSETGENITANFMSTGGKISPSTGVLYHPDLTLIDGIGEYLEISGEIKLELEFKTIDKSYQTCNEVFIWSDGDLYDEDKVCISSEQIFPTLDL